MGHEWPGTTELTRCGESLGLGDVQTLPDTQPLNRLGILFSGSDHSDLRLCV
jgi:hypothetical protein